MNIASSSILRLASRLGHWARWAQTLFGRAQIFFMLQVPAPVVALGDEGSADMLDEVEKALSDGSLGGRVSTTIQERYLSETAKARHDLTVRMAIFGTFMFDAFLYADIWAIPDIIWLAIGLKIGIATPYVAFLISLYRNPRIVARLPHDIVLALMASALAMFTGVTLVLIFASHDVNAALLAFALSLILIAANVVLAFPFKWALTITIVGNAAIDAAILLHPRLGGALQHFIPLFNVGVSVLSLVGNYRIEAGARIAYLFALREALQAARLANANLRLRDLVHIDGLTGIGNRRHFDDRLASHWRVACGGRPLALLMIDIDHFKALNDRFGHLAGDECIRMVARTLGCVIRPGVDTLARYGGEEFAVLIEGATLEEARDIALRVRSAVAGLDIPFPPEPQPLRVTISIGCGAVEPEPGESAMDFVAATDAALYRAKQNGRNRVEIATLDRSPPGATPIARVA